MCVCTCIFTFRCDLVHITNLNNNNNIYTYNKGGNGAATQKASADQVLTTPPTRGTHGENKVNGGRLSPCR